MNGKILALAALLLLGISSCHKPEADLALRFSFSVGDETLQQDTNRYVNAAGNHFSVTEVQYFISKVVLTHEDGTQYALQTDDGIHYVDVDIPSTLSWQLKEDRVPVGKYARLDFVFGLAPEYNVSHFFVNPPENSMSWPEALGGGYHHMKLNGRWFCPETSPSPVPFAMHLGTGQIYEDGQIAGFVDNAFTVSIPLNDVVLSAEDLNILDLNMDILQWFQNPYVFDFAQDGTAIMQNQEAIGKLVANGKTVFTVRFPG
ncbi:MAG: hypothetical protein IKU03_00865 [Bacteroidales bacterium]|nr:hypothetical protein [Bacteroidales bacterium]